MLTVIRRTAFAVAFLLGLAIGASSAIADTPRPLTAKTICDALGYCPGQGSWYSLGRAPLSSEGKLGDLWFRSATADIYQRGVSTWSIVANIRGLPGMQVLNGAGAPGGGVGNNGDFYIDTTAHAIYGPKAAGAWGSSTSLVGPTGATGSTGPAGANAYTATTAGFTMPAVSSTVSVSVGATGWMVAGEVVYVGTAGYMNVSSITNGTTLVLQNAGVAGNAAGGASISSGVAVAPGGVAGAGTINSATIGQLGIYSGGTAISGITVGGDCTQSSGSFICTKTNGTSFATVATSGSASDLGAGTLPSGRLTGAYSGITGLGTLTSLGVSGTSSFQKITETFSAPTISSGTLTIDLSQGSVFNVSNNANITTFTISNPPTSKAGSFTLILTANGSGFTQAWGSSVKWPGGTAPTLTTTNAKRDVLTFVTNDGGTTWFAFVGGQNY